RLARDLHDDLAQRMVGLTMQLQSIALVLPSGTSEHVLLQRACDEASALSQDIQAISHRLHSSSLEHVGLAAAATSLCRGLSEQHHVRIEFTHDHIPVELPKDIALCMFRVLQEALTNALKHSRSQEIQGWLRGGVREIELVVRDVGTGFDTQRT